MSETLVKIPVLSYVQRHMPADFALGTRSWFKKQTCSINFGEYTGSYGTVGALRASILNPMFAQWWYIVSASDNTTGANGRPEKVVTREEVHGGKDVTEEKGEDKTDGTSKAHSSATNRSDSSSASSSSFDSESTSSSRAGTDSYENANDENYASSSGRSRGRSSSSGSGHANSNAESTGNDEQHGTTNRSKEGTTTYGHTVTVTTTENGDPYYCSKAVVNLERIILDNQKAIDALAASFVAAHNDGKKINVDRYEELVNLYATVVSRTEDEMNNIRPIAPEDLRDLIDGVVRDCKTALDLFRDKVGEIPDDFGNSRIEEINRKLITYSRDEEAEEEA